MQTETADKCPSILKNAQFLVKSNPNNIDNWWSQEVEGMHCYLLSTMNDCDTADFSDCLIGIVFDSFEHAVQVFMKNREESEKDTLDYLNIIHETVNVPKNELCCGYGRESFQFNLYETEWYQRQVQNGKFVYPQPGLLESLVPLCRESAELLMQALPEVENDDYGFSDPDLIRENCALFLK